MTLEKYNWLLKDKSIVIDGRKTIGKTYTIMLKGKPNLIAKCTGWFSSGAGSSSVLQLIN